MTDTVRLIEDLTDRALGRTEEPTVLSRPPTRSMVAEHLGAAFANARVDQMPEPAGRSRFLKRLVLKLTGFAFVRQASVNQAFIGTVNALLQEIDHLSVEMEQERRRSAAAITSFELNVIAGNQQHREVVERLTARVADLAQSRELIIAQIDEARRLADRQASAAMTDSERITAQAKHVTRWSEAVEQLAVDAETQSKTVEDLATALQLEDSRRRTLERQLGLVKAELVRTSVSDGVSQPDPALDGIPLANLTEVYERFEAHFRPAGADLDRRFAVYLERLAFLADGRFPVLDVGTGRGDFLAVLADARIPAKGIDLNPEGVDQAVGRGFDVVLADALEYLGAQPSESIGAVCALHVVEHLDAEVLVRLVDEIVRVLIPGGLIIFETPNPTNLVVGASSFYHDPTHHRPITPDYLSFLLHDRGFTDVQTEFLNPLPEFLLPLPTFEQPGFRSLQLLLEDVRWALKGPQEYAVIGRRPGGR